MKFSWQGGPAFIDLRNDRTKMVYYFGLLRKNVLVIYAVAQL